MCVDVFVHEHREFGDEPVVLVYIYREEVADALQEVDVLVVVPEEKLVEDDLFLLVVDRIVLGKEEKHLMPATLLDSQDLLHVFEPQQSALRVLALHVELACLQDLVVLQLPKGWVDDNLIRRIACTSTSAPGRGSPRKGS